MASEKVDRLEEAERAQEALEARLYLTLPDEKDFPEWIVFKLSLDTSGVKLAEVGQVRAANSDLAILAITQHHPGSDGSRFVAFEPERLRGRKVHISYNAHLED